MTTYLENFIFDKQAVLDHARRYPAMSPKKKPTIDVALKAVQASVEHHVSAFVIETYRPLVAEAYDLYEINNGTYEETFVDQRDEWESGLDDEIEKIVEPLTQLLSASWLGEYTVNTRLFEEGAIDRWCASLGKEVFKQLSYNKEPGQVLANAGITRPDVEAWLAESAKPRSEDQQQEDTANMEEGLEKALKSIREQIGTEFDAMEVYQDLEQVLDDDDVLSGSSASRLGMSEDDVNAAKLYALDVGNEACAEFMLKALQNDGSDVPMPEAKPKRQKAASSTPPAPKAMQPEGWNGQAVIEAVRKHSGVKETDFAALLGVSRSTYNNWGSGKTAFAPTAEQRETLRNQLCYDLNGLYAALCAVDGVGVTQVFE